MSGKECPNGHEGFIDVIRCPSVDVPALGLRRIGLVVVEIWGDLFLPLKSIFCGILDVWGLLRGKECPNGHEDFIDVRGDLYVDVSTLGSNRIGPGVGEIWGEVPSPTV